MLKMVWYLYVCGCIIGGISVFFEKIINIVFWKYIFLFSKWIEILVIRYFFIN